jgi:hypothetical protein
MGDPGERRGRENADSADGSAERVTTNTRFLGAIT